VVPPLYLGTDVAHSPDALRDLGFAGDEQIVGMDFPANSVRSLYADETLFAATVRHQVEMLAERGWRMIALVSGHGGENQVEALTRIAGEITAAGGASVLYCRAWLDTSGLPAGHSGGGHADDGDIADDAPAPGERGTRSVADK